MPFTSFSCLITLARSHSIISNGSGGSGHLFLVPDQSFNIEYDVSCRLVMYGLYHVEVGSFYTQFIESFCHERILNFIECFFFIYWDNLMIFIFNSIKWCITFIDLHILSHLCIPGIIPTWSWCMILLMCCWIQFPSTLLRIFASIFIKDIGLFFFLVVSLPRFGIRVLGLVK